MLSCVRLFATLSMDFYQAPLSMGFSQQQCWSGLPFPPPGIFPTPGSAHVSCGTCIADRFFSAEPLGKPIFLEDESPEPRSPPKLSPFVTVTKSPLVITNKLPDSQLGKDAHSSKHPLAPPANHLMQTI